MVQLRSTYVPGSKGSGPQSTYRQSGADGGRELLSPLPTVAAADQDPFHKQVLLESPTITYPGSHEYSTVEPMANVDDSEKFKGYF